MNRHERRSARHEPEVLQSLLAQACDAVEGDKHWFRDHPDRNCRTRPATDAERRVSFGSGSGNFPEVARAIATDPVFSGLTPVVVRQFREGERMRLFLNMVAMPGNPDRMEDYSEEMSRSWWDEAVRSAPPATQEQIRRMERGKSRPSAN